MMVTSASVIPHLKSGKLRALAVISTKRVPQLPDVPTMLELGYPDLTLGSWQGIYAPQKMPQAIIKETGATAE